MIQPEYSSPQKPILWMLLVITILIIGKLWLVEAQSINAWGNAGHDDQLFVRLAEHLVRGEWLGPYDNLTLSKGPFYPLWIAASFVFGLPLLLSQHLLYIAACLVFIVAMRPLVKSRIILVLLFGWLLYNPASYTDGVMTRVIREGIYPSLTLLVIACAIGLLLRQHQDSSTSWFWAGGLGFSLAALWLTREEGAWVLPFLLVVIGYAAAQLWKLRHAGWLKPSGKWGISLLTWIIPILVISAINNWHYGIFAKTEIDHHSFSAAYGALTRVKPTEWQQYVPMARETRMRVYPEVPAFAELQPYLEGEIGKGYIVASVGDFNGGGFMWVLRDAVAAAGYYDSGKYPSAYYLRLAEEVNAACQAGKWDCFPKRSSFMPPWRKEYLPLVLTQSWQSLLFSLRYQNYTPVPAPSKGNELDLALFRDLTRERLAQADRSRLYLGGWVFKENDSIRLFVRDVDASYANMSVGWLPSLDVYQHYLSLGNNYLTAKKARFTLTTECLKDCTLEIWDTGNLLMQIPLQVKSLAPGPLSEGSVYFYLESFYKRNDSQLLPLQAVSDKIKLEILRKIGRIYQLITLPLFCLSLLVYVYLMVSQFYKSVDRAAWVILTSLLILYITRLGLIATISATSWPAVNHLYLSPAAAPLLLLIGLSLYFGSMIFIPWLKRVLP